MNWFMMPLSQIYKFEDMNYNKMVMKDANAYKKKLLDLIEEL